MKSDAVYKKTKRQIQKEYNYADGSDSMDARIAESNAWSAGLQKFSGG